MKRQLAWFAALALWAPVAASAQPWSPPIGVPEPDFGIDEEAGATTHYVDNTNGSCSDAGNGTPSVPRCTIPEGVAAGSVVEIHGGPYVGGTLTLGGDGNVSQPIVYSGASGMQPIIDGATVEVAGTFVIVEGLEITDSRVRVGTGAGSQYVALRATHVHHHPTGSLVAANGSDIVLYDNHIHHNTRTGNDGHGIFVAEGSTRVWVVDNDVHHHTGDGIQFCHGCTTAPPDTVYVGRNRFYTNRENGIDIKYAQNVVISENTVYDHASAPADVPWCFEDNSLCGTWSSGSDGSAVVLGSDGGPSNIWFIANEVYDSAVGVRNEETYDAWIVGNVIRDIDAGGSAIALEKVGQPLVISYNTIVNAEVGVDQFWQPNFVLTISNNIIAGMRGRFVNVETDTVAAASTMESNLFWNGGATVALRWVTNQSFDSTADFGGFAGGAGNVVGSPDFELPASNIFRLAPGSAAIDAGNDDLTSINAALMMHFSPVWTLAYDRNGTFRPTDGDGSASAELDIGAYEYDPGFVPPTDGGPMDGGGESDGDGSDGGGADGGGVSGDTVSNGQGDADSGGNDALAAGCNCDSGASGAWLAAVALLLLRRRRQTPTR